MFSFMYMSFLSKLLVIHIHPWATCLHAYTFVDSSMFGYVVYSSLYKSYICLEVVLFCWKLDFHDFHVLRNFTLSLLPYFMIVWWYDSYTHLIWYLLMIFCFVRLYELYCYLSVDDRVIFMFLWIYSCFIPYLKDFVLVFKFFI